MVATPLEELHASLPHELRVTPDVVPGDVADVLTYADSPDAPLRKLAPSGGWLSPPITWYVRAPHAERALELALHCHYTRAGEIPRKYSGLVARSLDDLPPDDDPVYIVQIGRKQGPRKRDRWLASELELITDETPGEAA